MHKDNSYSQRSGYLLYCCLQESRLKTRSAFPFPISKAAADWH